MSGLLRLLLHSTLLFSLGASGLYAQSTRLYLLPGTGADERLFDALDLAAFDTVHVKLPVPLRKETMATYAARIATNQIDTTRPFALLGVSLGGMVATELSEQLDPLHTVIVASAKTRHELPPGYRMGRFLPVHVLVGGRTMRWFTKQIQPSYEPMEPEQRDLFIAMLYDKDPKFLRRAVRLMVGWQRRTVPPNITHVQGQLDRTLPIAYTAPTYGVRGEGHMLTYSKPEVVEWVLSQLTTQ